MNQDKVHIQFMGIFMLEIHHKFRQAFVKVCVSKLPGNTLTAKAKKSLESAFKHLFRAQSLQNGWVFFPSYPFRASIGL